MESTKQERLLEIFFRCLRGESLSVQKLADEYGLSTKSISRNINDLKAFLADHRELVGNTKLIYSSQERSYHLYMDEFLTNKELFALIEVMIGARAFSKEELLSLTNKLKGFLTATDRPVLNDLKKKNSTTIVKLNTIVIAFKKLFGNWQSVSPKKEKSQLNITEQIVLGKRTVSVQLL